MSIILNISLANIAVLLSLISFIFSIILLIVIIGKEERDAFITGLDAISNNLSTLLRARVGTRVANVLIDMGDLVFSTLGVFSRATLASLDSIGRAQTETAIFLQRKVAKFYEKNREVCVFLVIALSYIVVYEGVPFLAQSLVPSLMLRYTDFAALSVFAFAVISLLWWQLNRTYFVTLNLRIEASKTLSRYLQFSSLFLAAVFWLIFGFYLLVITQLFAYLNRADFVMTVFSIVQLLLFTIILYLSYRTVRLSSLKKIGITQEIAKMRKCIQFGQASMPLLIREGGSDNISIDISLLDKISGSLEAEIQAAGLRINGQNPQTKKIDSNVSFLWSCCFPKAGSHVLNIMLKAHLDSTEDACESGPIIHKMRVNSLARQSLLPVVTSIFIIAANVVTAAHYVGLF